MIFEHRTILATIVGSRAYGIHTASSDLDVIGVAVPPANVLFGCTKHFEQSSGREAIGWLRSCLSVSEEAAAQNGFEGTIYSLQKFCQLAMAGNPSILDVLFCDDTDVLWATPEGELLRKRRDLFLSQRCRHTFSGYAMQQLKRIRLHRRWIKNPPTHKPTRAEFGLFDGISEQEMSQAMAMVRKVVDSWELDLGAVDKAARVQIHTKIEEFLAEREILRDGWMAATRKIGLGDNFMALLQAESAYKQAKADWDNYQTWRKNRNPKRAALELEHGYDTKHAAHLYRLLKMGLEVLRDGVVLVRRDDADKIRDIRNGRLSYSELVATAERMDAELADVYESGESPLPRNLNRDAVNDLCCEVTRLMIRED